MKIGEGEGRGKTLFSSYLPNKTTLVANKLASIYL